MCWPFSAFPCAYRSTSVEGGRVEVKEESIPVEPILTWLLNSIPSFPSSSDLAIVLAVMGPDIARSVTLLPLAAL